jgi:hypothetical protein
MTGADTIRWAIIFGCAMNFGFMVALYEKVGKLVVPAIWTRGLVVANIGFFTILALGLHSRLGDPLTWRTPAFGVFVALQLICEVGLYRWYGKAEGREHARRMLEGRK